MDITELIENGMQGDERALTALYGLYVGKVVEVCNVIVRDRMDATGCACQAWGDPHRRHVFRAQLGRLGCS